MNFASMNIVGSWIDVKNNIPVYNLDDKYEKIFVLGINFENGDSDWAAITVVEFNKHTDARTRYLSGYLNKEITKVHSIGLISPNSDILRIDPVFIIACVKKGSRNYLWLTTEKGFPINIGHEHSIGSKMFDIDIQWNIFSVSEIELNFNNYLLIAIVDEETEKEKSGCQRKECDSG